MEKLSAAEKLELRRQERRKSREAQLEREVQQLRDALEQERLRREADELINERRVPLDPETSRRIAGHIGKRLPDAGRVESEPNSTRPEQPKFGQSAGNESTAQILDGNEVESMEAPSSGNAARESADMHGGNAGYGRGDRNGENDADDACDGNDKSDESDGDDAGDENDENDENTVVSMHTLPRVKPTLATRYEDRLAVTEEICSAMIAGKSLHDICRHDQFPNINTFLRWCGADGDIYNLYLAALRMRAAQHAEKVEQNIKELEKETDMVRVAALRGAIQSRQWVMSKMLPKLYGDRVEHTHEHEHKHDIKQLDERLAALIANTKSGRA